jgi:tRNA nucleotidyltransferase/poly(A) polymerase
MATIELTRVEKKIFKTLISINDKYSIGATFRIAGGWVRDKLLGNNSDDIDISIDVITGQQFCKFLKKEINVNVHIIEANHSQCKHLEVASVTLFGIEIDFLQLRSDEYGTSRIPQIKLGTPEEDAMRRDLTINSLFYNINTNTIEDFTGGLDDLRNKLIRTPLDIVTTLSDDPLRILRAIRFCVTLKDFTLDPQLVSTIIDNNELKLLLKNKVSQERILIEIRKIIDINAVKGIRVMQHMKIFKYLLNVDICEEFLHIIDRYEEQISKTMDIVTFVSLIYYDKDYEKFINQLKITNKEKREAVSIIIAINSHIELLEDDTIVKIGRIIFNIDSEYLLDVSINIIKSIVDKSKFDIYKDKIDNLRWVLGMKPVINGHDIAKLFNAKGTQIRTLLDKVIDLQIMNKEYTKKTIIEQLVAEVS